MARWTASLHPRARNGEFRKKAALSPAAKAARKQRRIGVAARAGVAVVPVLATSVTAVKAIIIAKPLIAIGSPVIGGAFIATAGLMVARSTSTARKIYIGGHIRKKHGAAAHAKFNRVNDRIDRGLDIASAGAAAVGAGGVLYKGTLAPIIGVQARKNRNYARGSPTIGFIPRKGSTGYANKRRGAYKISTGPVGKAAKGGTLRAHVGSYAAGIKGHRVKMPYDPKRKGARRFG